MAHNTFCVQTRPIFQLPEPDAGLWDFALSLACLLYFCAFPSLGYEHGSGNPPTPDEFAHRLVPFNRFGATGFSGTSLGIACPTHYYNCYQSLARDEGLAPLPQWSTGALHPSPLSIARTRERLRQLVKTVLFLPRLCLSIARTRRSCYLPEGVASALPLQGQFSIARTRKCLL